MCENADTVLGVCGQTVLGGVVCGQKAPSVFSSKHGNELTHVSSVSQILSEWQGRRDLLHLRVMCVPCACHVQAQIVCTQRSVAP